MCFPVVYGIACWKNRATLDLVLFSQCSWKISAVSYAKGVNCYGGLSLQLSVVYCGLKGIGELLRTKNITLIPTKKYNVFGQLKKEFWAGIHKGWNWILLIIDDP